MAAAMELKRMNGSLDATQSNFKSKVAEPRNPKLIKEPKKFKKGWYY